MVEALQVTILEACEKGFYKGLYLSESGTNVSLLQYADDAFFFGDWSRLNATNLIHILECFELASGLKINISKRRIIGIGVPTNEVEFMAASLGCSHESLPFTYLGLPVGKKMRVCDGWNEVINRFRERLSSWKVNALIIGRRLTLVKSCLVVFNFITFLCLKPLLRLLRFWNLLEAVSFGGSKTLFVVLVGLSGAPSS